MEQKKFMDISRIKEDTELTVANTGGFHVGDYIAILEARAVMEGINL